MKRTLGLAVVTVLALCGVAHADAANLVVNGGFEQGTLGIGSFDGWETTLRDGATYVDSTGETGMHFGQAIEGLWTAYFGTTAAAGGSSISQVLSTTPNQTYLLSFALANDNDGLTPSNNFATYINGEMVLSFNNMSDQNYSYERHMFLATSNSTVLSFSAYNDQSYLELDDVSVSAAPEPSGAAFSLIGLLLVATAVTARVRTSRTQ